MKVNSKVGYMSNIMLLCNQFIVVRRTIGPTDAHWGYFIGYENRNSTNVQLGIREHWERFLIKVFVGKLEILCQK